MGSGQPSARRACRAARLAGAGLITVLASLAAAYVLLPLATRAIVRALTLTVNGCVWIAASVSAGADPWVILSAVARAAGDALATREASSILIALIAIGGLAFYGLQRLLGSEEESS